MAQRSWLRWTWVAGLMLAGIATGACWAQSGEDLRTFPLAVAELRRGFDDEARPLAAWWDQSQAVMGLTSRMMYEAPQGTRLPYLQAMQDCHRVRRAICERWVKDPAYRRSTRSLPDYDTYGVHAEFEGLGLTPPERQALTELRQMYWENLDLYIEAYQISKGPRALPVNVLGRYLSDARHLTDTPDAYVREVIGLMERWLQATPADHHDEAVTQICMGLRPNLPRRRDYEWTYGVTASRLEPLLVWLEQRPEPQLKLFALNQRLLLAQGQSQQRLAWELLDFIFPLQADQAYRDSSYGQSIAVDALSDVIKALGGEKAMRTWLESRWDRVFERQDLTMFLCFPDASELQVSDERGLMYLRLHGKRPHEPMDKVLGYFALDAQGDLREIPQIKTAGAPQPLGGEIYMRRQDKYLKFNFESWSFEPSPAPPSPPGFVTTNGKPVPPGKSLTFGPHLLINDVYQLVLCTPDGQAHDITIIHDDGHAHGNFRSLLRIDDATFLLAGGHSGWTQEQWLRERPQLLRLRALSATPAPVTPDPATPSTRRGRRG